MGKQLETSDLGGRGAGPRGWGRSPVVLAGEAALGSGTGDTKNAEPEESPMK